MMVLQMFSINVSHLALFEPTDSRLWSILNRLLSKNFLASYIACWKTFSTGLITIYLISFYIFLNGLAKSATNCSACIYKWFKYKNLRLSFTATAYFWYSRSLTILLKSCRRVRTCVTTEYTSPPISSLLPFVPFFPSTNSFWEKRYGRL